jgi:RNA polymerase sigma-70 factor, ECF subfamily
VENFDPLLEAARAGEEWAFARLYDTLHPSLLRYLRWQEPAVADDLASETWLAVAEGLGRFEGDEQAFRGWVFTIARRRLATHRRSAGRQRTMPVGPDRLAEVRDTEDPSDVVMDRMSAQSAIAQLASVLPPEQAEVVVLRVVGGLTVDEVARVIGKRPGTVRVLQHRALRRLSTQFKDHFILEV